VGVRRLAGTLYRVLVATTAELALALLAVGMLGVTMAPGPRLAKYSASGTTIMPTMTVSTKVTAPHSLCRTAQFTSAEFYRDWEVG